jgi:hypothetical protein
VADPSEESLHMGDRFTVRMTENERQYLATVIRNRRCSPSLLVRALILRRADAARAQPVQSNHDIARQVHASSSTVYRVRKRFVEGGIEFALFSQRVGRHARLPALAD